MTINRITCTWSGFTGAPGYSQFYWVGSAGIQNLFTPFWQACAPYIPSVVTVTVPNTGDVLDQQTGKKLDIWTSGIANTTSGTATVGVGFSMASGAHVNWFSSVYVKGQRLRGKTYLVPLATTAYASNGVLTTACANAINAAATSLFQGSGGGLCVWHRPIYNPTDPTDLVEQGSIGPITSTTTPTKVSVLRSRRDN